MRVRDGCDDRGGSVPKRGTKGRVGQVSHRHKGCSTLLMFRRSSLEWGMVGEHGTVGFVYHNVDNPPGVRAKSKGPLGSQVLRPTKTPDERALGTGWGQGGHWGVRGS